MGGCRCSYRTCNKVTDGKTHFFHYPVRDENRCNQWIKNANRLDLKNVTRSQLKNKVICENHFAENMFMNYRHERLTHTAVPNKEHDNDTPDELPILFKKETRPSTDVTNEEVSSTVMGTDVVSINKEMSTMSVNVSSITGLSFFPPHEKKTNSAPYIELLTRLHNNPLIQSNTEKNFLPTKNSTSKELSKVNVLKSGTSQNESSHKEDQFNTLARIRQNKITAELKKPRIIRSKKICELNKSVQDVLKPEKVIKKVIENNTISTKQLNLSVTNSVNDVISLKPYRPQSIIIENANALNSDSETLIIDSDIPNTVDNDINNKSVSNLSSMFKNINNNRISNGDIIILPLNSDVSGTTNNYNEFNIETGTQTSKEDEQADFLSEGKRMLTELKTVLDTQKEIKKKMNTRRIAVGRVKKSQFRPLSKPSLYAQIVPFLSPSTALLVHKEMFPSMRHMHRS